MKFTVEIPDDAFCEECPFYVQQDEEVDYCQVIPTGDDEDDLLVDFIKVKGKTLRVKSENCPNRAGVKAREKLNNIQTEDIEDDCCGDSDEEEDEE
jgi:hypothetical protein